jgi:Tol biopolymer transport system component
MQNGNHQNMKNIQIFPVVLIGLAAAIFLAGCGTMVTINSDPAQASVYQKGLSMGTTPYTTPPIGPLSGNWLGELRKDGYVPKPISLSSGGPTNVLIKLERPKITLTSIPGGASVYTQTGEMVGQTPVVIPLTSDTQTYELRLMSYNSKSVTLTPSSPQTFEVNMGTQIPGNVYQELVVVDRKIQVQSSVVFADRDVIERSPSVRAVRWLTDFPATRWVGGFALSPDGKRLIMDVLDQEPAPDGTLTKFSNLWSIDVGAGGSMKRCTDGNYIDDAPCFSPDGKFVYFASSRAGKNSIFRVANQGGGGLSLVTPGTTIDRFPQISPNSQLLMWTAFTEGTTIPQIWSLSLSANGLPTGLPMQLREGQEPRWSPDGKTILCAVMDRNVGKWKIWTMQPDGTQPTQLTTGSDANDIHPSWSPDGSKIIFASDRGISGGIPNYDIWIMNADGSNPQQLTTNGSRDDHPIISPDGKTIYFRSNRGLKWDVWVMELAEQ